MAEGDSKAGQYLKRKREEQGIPLEAVARITRITLTYLQFLERDELDRHAAEIFVRGYLRNYAKFLHLDPEEVLSLYHPPPNPERDSLSSKNKPEAPSRSPGKFILHAFIGLLFTVLGAAPSFSLGKAVLPHKH